MPYYPRRIPGELVELGRRPANDADAPQRVFSTGSLFAADFVKESLDAAGIHSYVEGAAIARTSAPIGSLFVIAKAAEADRARDVIRELLDEQAVVRDKEKIGAALDHDEDSNGNQKNCDTDRKD